MEPLQHPDIDVPTLAAAIEAEAAYERIWLPPEPWWDPILMEKESFAEAIHRLLLRGTIWPQASIVDARKPGHGVRPIALMTPGVRIVYRALVSALVGPSERADRSARRYADFVMEPIRNAYEPSTGLKRVGDAKYSHVVTTDLAAFYQYVDHAILRDELDLAGSDVEIVDALAQFLAEIEGRTFGIPQRSEPSDWISEYCAARVERSLIREGFDVWRYSDDFRIGCKSYSEVLGAIESLSRAARDVGLILNEKKTTTPHYLTYFMENADTEVDDASAEIDPVDVEAAVTTEYVPEDDEQAATDAEETILHLWDPEQSFPRPDEPWDIKTLDVEQNRAVRRALNTLTRHEDSSAVPVLLSLLAYQPAMTHQVIRYAEAVSATSHEAIESLLDKAIRRLSMNEWQRAWIAYGFRACNIGLAADSERAGWLTRRLASGPDSLAAAESAVTLSNAGLTDFAQLDGFVRIANDDFVPWYLSALSLMYKSGLMNADQRAALRRGSPVAAAVLR